MMISVIMPVYNSQPFLHKAINSILNQTMGNFQLIIINDGSTDNSEEIILAYNDSRIQYYKQENQGVAAARNKGLELAEGDFVIFQDSDDISLPMRFERLMSGVGNENIGIVHSDAMLINQDDMSIGYWHAHNIDRSSLLRFFIKIGSPIIGPTIMVRRQALTDFSYDTSLSIGEDNNMIYQILKNWEDKHISEPLYLYRRHTSNTTKTQISSLHLIKLINSHSLIELVPELDWENADHAENEIAACAIISTFLFKRGAVVEAKELLNNALLASKGKNVQIFVSALAKLVLGQYQDALDLLERYKEKDHIIVNYIGECLAYMGQIDLAKEHFIESLHLKPDYTEPIDNLKSVGGIRNMNLLDRSWEKFRRK